MKTATLFAAALISVTASNLVFAQYNGPNFGSNAGPYTGMGVTRAQVSADLDQARANGELKLGDEYHYAPAKQASAGKTRAEVLAELEQARKDGKLAVGDASYPSQPAQTSDRYRYEVRSQSVSADKLSSYNKPLEYRN
ncbi:DUF4148 domain-containing protein [Undibacterium terreum]|uniref:DUF4148 domain-containing protein n=1 Tax=Undibacterium terreum TaxID=1224302 RepID=A0A916XQM5_9BURK|nr:DUF4148 domain-containing protein [Undibacterium terreum]GGC97574.1 hypothetical protein GCM10011396_51380 [Undibacterium terreum]